MLSSQEAEGLSVFRYLWRNWRQLLIAAMSSFFLSLVMGSDTKFRLPDKGEEFTTLDAWLKSHGDLSVLVLIVFICLLIAFIVGDAICDVAKIVSRRARYWDWHEYSLMTLILLGWIGTPVMLHLLG